MRNEELGQLCLALDAAQESVDRAWAGGYSRPQGLSALLCAMTR